jgi:hypothetical protein
VPRSSIILRPAFAALLLLRSPLLLADPPVTCLPGFVAREARPADRICVTPASHARVAGENARAPLLWTPGPFGARTCAQGFVWRNAYPGDLICVTPAIRSEVQNENDTAASRQQ